MAADQSQERSRIHFRKCVMEMNLIDQILVSTLNRGPGSQRATTHSASSSRTTNATHNRCASLKSIPVPKVANDQRSPSLLHFIITLRPVPRRRLIRHRATSSQNHIFSREPYPRSRTSRIFLVFVFSQHRTGGPP